MKRKYLLVIAAAALVSGCARNDVHDNINDAVLETESKEDIKPLKSGTLELFRAFDEGFDEYIFSPEMLRKNFYTVANYADGDTKQDIETVFNFPDAYNDNDTITKNKDINCFSRTYINRSKMEEAKLSELSDGKIIPMGITMEELDNEKTKLNEMAEDVIESFPHDFINEYSGISMLHYVRFNKPLAVPCESNLSQIEEGARVDYFISGYTSNLNIKESEDKTINILRLPFVTNDGEDQFSLYLFCDALNSNQMGV